MKSIIQRIGRSALFVTLIAMALSGCGLFREMGRKPEPTPAEVSSHYLLLVAGGSGEAGEIRSYTLHPLTLAMQHTGTIASLSPSFLALTEDRGTILVTNETESESTVSSYRLDPASGELSLLSSAYTIGEGPAYVATKGRFVVTANYAGGSISLTEIDGEGLLQPVDWHIRVGDKGVSHPHSVYFTSDGSQLFATDLGQDRILHFGIRQDTPPITLDAAQVTLPDGSGPRHLILSKDDRFAYVVCEQTPQIFVYRNDDGSLTEIQRVSTRRSGTGGGHIALTHDGRFLYISHRDGGGDAIVAFTVDGETGLLTYAGTTPTGRHPRHFALSPDDRYMAVALRDDAEIRFYRRDIETGSLTPIEEKIQMERPMFVLWESFPN